MPWDSYLLIKWMLHQPILIRKLKTTKKLKKNLTRWMIFCSKLISHRPNLTSSNSRRIKDIQSHLATTNFKKIKVKPSMNWSNRLRKTPWRKPNMTNKNKSWPIYRNKNPKKKKEWEWTTWCMKKLCPFWDKTNHQNQAKSFITKKNTIIWVLIKLLQNLKLKIEPENQIWFRESLLKMNLKTGENLIFSNSLRKI